MYWSCKCCDQKENHVFAKVHYVDGGYLKANFVAGSDHCAGVSVDGNEDEVICEHENQTDN